MADYVIVLVNEFLTLTEATSATMRVDAIELHRIRDQLRYNFKLLRSKLLISIC